MAVKVAKFGGTSLADAAQMLKVKAIVEADAERRFVVVSAPGKRHAKDQKVTDVLYACHGLAEQGLPYEEVWLRVVQRFEAIVDELGLGLDLSEDIADAYENIGRAAERGDGPDYAASCGEFFSGRVMAALLDRPFVDPEQLIKFADDGAFLPEETYRLVGDALRGAGSAVVPGFYGSRGDGRVKTFSRGGSDVTGSIVARAVDADVYENWTDVSGLLMTDPRIVPSPEPIEVITYRELRELSYMGASVLHEDAVFPVRQTSIPVNIRNTNLPDDPGTLILSTEAAMARGLTATGEISGVAGRRGFVSILIEKAMMNAQIGFGRRVLSVLEDHGVSYEHTPSGIDTLSVIVSSEAIKGKLERVIEDIGTAVSPDRVEVEEDLALIATVGRGMAHTPGMAAKLFTALAGAGVNCRMMDQGSSELNIIVGVAGDSFERAVRAIYAAFVGGG